MTIGSASTQPDAPVRRSRLVTAVLLSALVIAAAFAGCTLPRQGTLQQECTADSQCDDQNPCTIESCSPEGMCDRLQAPDGPLPEQTAEDCTLQVCALGQQAPQFDPSDISDDGNQCTVDSCTE